LAVTKRQPKKGEITMTNGNRQGSVHGSRPMKTVRSSRQAISNVHAIVGGVLLGVGLLVFAMHLFFDHSAAVRALVITGGTLALSGMVELIVSSVLRRSVRREQEKLARLKFEGVTFAGEITHVQRHYGIHLGRFYSVHVECTYENHEGKVCLVRSQSFLRRNENSPMFQHRMAWADTPQHDNYAVWIYVNPHNPHDYAVEVFEQLSEANSNYDYRYSTI